MTETRSDLYDIAYYWAKKTLGYLDKDIKPTPQQLHEVTENLLQDGVFDMLIDSSSTK